MKDDNICSKCRKKISIRSAFIACKVADVIIKEVMDDSKWEKKNDKWVHKV